MLVRSLHIHTLGTQADVRTAFECMEMAIYRYSINNVSNQLDEKREPFTYVTRRARLYNVPNVLATPDPPPSTPFNPHPANYDESQVVFAQVLPRFRLAPGQFPFNRMATIHLALRQVELWDLRSSRHPPRARAADTVDVFIFFLLHSGNYLFYGHSRTDV